MNKTVSGIFLGLVLGIGATWLVLHRTGSTQPASTEPASDTAKEKENALHFPPAKRTAAGLALAKPTEIALAPEAAAFGRVLDPTPLVALTAELETARAGAEASAKEYDRVKKLFAAGGNASTQTVETAEANAARDHAAFNSAQARLIAAWGRDLAKNLEAVNQALAEGATLARLDVLPGDAVADAPKTARVSLPGNPETFEAEVLGPAPVADPQVQGASFLVLVRNRPLAVGAALRGTIPGVGESTRRLVVPRSAIVYHQGSAWIFVLGEEDTFERKLVSVGRAVGNDGVVVIQGLDAAEHVVTTGAQQLLAAELQAGGAPAEE